MFKNPKISKKLFKHKKEKL